MEGIIVSNINETDNKLNFTLNNSDVSVVNALRRVILSNINTIVFRGFPDSENQIKFHKNTTKFNNEYLKHRLSCIPVVNSDSSTFESFCNLNQILIHVENNTLEQRNVTTDDIKIIDKKTKTPIEEDISVYFPHDSITNEPILICVLYPNYNTLTEENEAIHIEANLSIGNAYECACWNVVHHCAYEAVQDEAQVANVANQINDPFEKKDFMLLDAQKIVKPQCFKLSLATIGIYSNKEIVQKACYYIMEKLSLMEVFFESEGKQPIIETKQQHLKNTNDGTLSREQRNNIEDTYCFVYKEDDFYILEIKQDDYTIGKLIEKHFYKEYESNISFVAFKKNHPTQENAFVYIQYKNNPTKQDIRLYQDMSSLIKKLLTLFRNILQEFK